MVRQGRFRLCAVKEPSKNRKRFCRTTDEDCRPRSPDPRQADAFCRMQDYCCRGYRIPCRASTQSFSFALHSATSIHLNLILG